MKINKRDEGTVLFGLSINNPRNLEKYSIYIRRCQNTNSSLSLLKAKTTETRELEFSIAKKNKDESIHYIKNQNILP